MSSSLSEKQAQNDDDDDADADDDAVFDAVTMIRLRRRNVREYTDSELQWWIQSYTTTADGSSSIPDYQMAAWLMAVCLNGLSPSNTATLTKAMVESGVRLQWGRQRRQRRGGGGGTHNNNDDCSSNQQRRRPLVDKHSTGGVGDKISIILAPTAASLGVGVPMMAGRGLGHTGGTIDKLESIPGFRCDLSVQEFQTICQSSTGCVISAATPELCPADKKLYALRDVTDTVASLPLQTASIMSKKIAENPDSLVLDVKYGSGAFQSSVEQAEALAVSMIHTGEANGLVPTTAFLTRMDQPIGCSVGNWLEVKECIQIMSGNGNNNFTPPQLNHDLVTLVVVQTAEMLQQSGLYPDASFEELMKKSLHALKDGSALGKFREMVVAQGGDPSVIDDPDSYSPLQPPQATVRADTDGYIAAVDALTVGEVSVLLGAGRSIAEAPVDACAGIWFRAKAGMKVRKGDIICEIYSNRETAVVTTAVQRLSTCIQYSSDPVTLPPIVSHRVSREKGTEVVTIPNLDF